MEEMNEERRKGNKGGEMRGRGEKRVYMVAIRVIAEGAMAFMEGES